MNTPQLAWLGLLPALMIFLFLIGALIFAITRKGDGSSAKQYAIFGLSILNRESRVVGTIAIPMLFQIFGPDSVPMYHSIYSMFSGLIYMIAIGLLVAAIFTGRESMSSVLNPEVESFPVTSRNPYSPPAS